MAALLALVMLWCSLGMKMSDIGGAKLTARYGTKGVAYRDSVAVWTV